MQNFARLQKKHPRGSGPFKKKKKSNPKKAESHFREGFASSEVENKFGFLIMHEQAAPSRDKARINVFTPPPPVEARSGGNDEEGT